jgi:hypothetical protein
VPDTDTVSLEFCALLINVMVAAIVPAVDGVKFTLMGVLFPGCRVTGKGKWLKVKFLLFFRFELIVRTLLPVLLSWKVNCFVDPIAT